MGGCLVVEDRQVEPAEAVGVGEDVDFDDLPAPDREAHDRDRQSFWGSPNRPKRLDGAEGRDAQPHRAPI